MESRKYWLVDRLVSSQWPEYGEHHCTAGHPSCVVTVCQCAGRGGGHHWPPASVARRPRGSPVRSPGLYLLPRAGLACSHCQILLSNIISAERGRERAINGSVVRPSWDQSPVIQCSGGREHQRSENRDNGNYRPRPNSDSAKGTESTTL